MEQIKLGDKEYSYSDLNKELRTKKTDEGEFPEETLEYLEDECHVNLTEFYGEKNDSPTRRRLIAKIKRHH